MTKPRLLLSGGTGFLGKQILPLLKEWAEVDIISRSGQTEVKGDLTLWDGGMGLDALSKKKYSAFIHLAGLYDLSAKRDDVLLNNVVATSNALSVTQALKIPIFVNASSIAAATNSPNSQVTPYDLTFSRKFPDAYAESKALAEQLILKWTGDIPSRLNLRLGILVGDSIEGKIERIDGPYHTPEAMKKIIPVLERITLSLPGNTMIFPGNENVKLPLVPVDQAAQATNKLILWMLNGSISGYHSFHLSPQNGVSIRDLYSSTLGYLKHPISFTLSHSLPDNLVATLGQKLLGFPKEQVRYALDLPVYESEQTRALLGNSWCSEFTDYESAFWRGYEKFLSNR